MVQLAEQEIKTELADPVKQTLRYIENHYREQVTLDFLAEQFNFWLPSFIHAIQTTDGSQSH